MQFLEKAIFRWWFLFSDRTKNQCTCDYVHVLCLLDLESRKRQKREMKKLITGFFRGKTKHYLILEAYNFYNNLLLFLSSSGKPRIQVEYILEVKTPIELYLIWMLQKRRNLLNQFQIIWIQSRPIWRPIKKSKKDQTQSIRPQLKVDRILKIKHRNEKTLYGWILEVFATRLNVIKKLNCNSWLAAVTAVKHQWFILGRKNLYSANRSKDFIPISSGPGRAMPYTFP